MRVRLPFRSPSQDGPSLGDDSYEGDKSQSIEWVFAHLHLDHAPDDGYDEDSVDDRAERRRPWLSRAVLAAMVVGVVGAGGLFTLSQMRSRVSAEGSGTNPGPAISLTSPAAAQITRPVSQPSPLAHLSAPETNPLPAQAVVENVEPVPQWTLPSLSAATAAPKQAQSPPADRTVVPKTMVSTGDIPVLSPLPVVADVPAASPASEPDDRSVGTAGTTEAVLTVRSDPAQHPDAALLPHPVTATPDLALNTIPAVVLPAPPAQAPAAPASATLAAIAPRTLAPVGVPFTIRLSFTDDQSDRAAVFARQLRREGFKVTSTVVPVIHGRWPGVAFFFNSDRERARLIARQLASVTGLKEHARLSPRHPYRKPGTVEVSLLRTSKSGDRPAETRAHTHHLP